MDKIYFNFLRKARRSFHGECSEKSALDIENEWIKECEPTKEECDEFHEQVITTKQPKQLIVRFAWENTGHCQLFYRVVREDKRKGMLLVLMDGEWYSAIDDNCWNEADCPIDVINFKIIIVD